MVQARNFAKRDNFTDAVARAELVCREVERALAAEQGAARSPIAGPAPLRALHRRWRDRCPWPRTSGDPAPLFGGFDRRG